MKKNKTNSKNSAQTEKTEATEQDDVVEAQEEREISEPGDCIGHWDDCEECKMCEIENSCMMMTKNIGGEEENAEEK